MPLSKKKFYFEVDEIMEIKLKSLIGKSYITSKDIEKIFYALVEQTYNDNAGRKLKIT